MKLSKFIIKLIGLFILISPAFAQEKPIETQTIIHNSEENIETIFNNFSLLKWDAREKEFPRFLDKIEHVKSTDDKNLLLARAYSMFPGKDYLDKALELTKDYLHKHPESSKGYLVYANILIEKIGFIQYLGPPSKWENKENIKLRDKALIIIEKSLNIKKSSQGYYLKALLSEGEDKIELLETSISMDLSRNDAWRELINELSRKHRYDEALSKLELWFNNSKSSEHKIEVLKKYACVLRDKREPEKAVKFLNSALLIRNATGSDGLETISAIDGIYLGLAQAYRDAKNNYFAEEYYKKYLAINPKAWYIRIDLALLYDNSGQVNKAISEYEQVLAYNENNIASIYNLGLLYKKIDEEKSKEFFIRYIDLEIDEEDEYSIKWVENAKSQLRSLGVYDYPESKAKLKEWVPKESNFSKLYFLFLFTLLIPLAWKYKKTTRALIIFSMTLAIAIISFFEAQSYSPNLVTAFLYFIPVISIGTFLLYLFRKPQ